MAEAFSIVTGALSVAALFNNCVASFEYIQLGRHFGGDYERCQLKLDIAKTRLSRWGQAANINNDPRFAIDEPRNKTSKQVQAVLEELDQLFVTLQKASKRYAIDAVQDDLALLRIEDMQPVAQNLHRRLGAIVKHRTKKTSLLKKTYWALYDAKNFEKLVAQATGFVDDLEKLVPVEGARRLVEIEIEEVKEDEPSLRALQTAATDTDRALAEVVTQRLNACEGGNSLGELENHDEARVRVGNEWGSSALGRDTGSLGPTQNRVDWAVTKGSSITHIGDSYGGRSIFDV
ncbi:prion-inhibition and propagation-domain-containing protein [Xylaria palmicola]|nr:prion-inhibition and propagation-domain-containing protein [Xylaria palmicola]